MTGNSLREDCIFIDIGDLQVGFLGDISNPKPRDALDSPIHIHARHEVQYIISGELLERINEDEQLHVGAGSFLVIPPGVMHRNTACNCQRLVLALTLHQAFVPEGFSEYQYYYDLLSRIHSSVVFSDDQISQYMQMLLLTTDAPEHLHKKRIILAMLFILLCQKLQAFAKDAIRSSVQQSSKSTDAQYHVIELFMNTHYMQKTSIHDVADVLHLSVRQASRVIQQIFGKSYAVLILERRMAVAHSLLRVSTMSCTTIAEKVGYSTYSGFHIAYHKYYGYSPQTTRAEAERKG